ncbi:alcohol dehydrogenase catalytic domain-containing protein [Klebsiella sp. R445]
MLPINYSAWVWHGGALPTGLQLETMPLPCPQAGQVLVQNQAIGLNPVDWKLLNIKQDKIPGVDGAGVVVAVGSGVSEHWVGQRVAWHQSLEKPGSFAEFTVLNVEVVMRIPNGLDTVTAAAFPCPGLTAWQALEKVPSRTGDRILIGGAGGSVGGFLVQLAHQRGFEVDVLSHPRHHARLTALGASHCYTTPDDTDNWVSPARYDVIIDSSSSESYLWLCRGLVANGHFVAILGRPESWPCKPFTRTFSLHEVALGALHIYGDVRAWDRLTADGERLLEQMEAGSLTGEKIITFKFIDLADYLLRLERRDFVGKLVAEV